MFIEGLTRVADLLDTIDPAQFNLNSWVDTAPTLNSKSKNIIMTPDCGYAGCACGWAASTDWFRDLGFHLERDSDYSGATLCFDEHRDWEAVMAFFDINFGLAQHLFSPLNYTDDYPTEPHHVAKRIRDTITAENRPVA